MTNIQNVQPPVNHVVSEAEAWLSAQHNIIASFSSLEELVVEGEENLNESTYNGILYHAKILRAEILKTLWDNDIYIGMSIVDELIFDFSKNLTGPTSSQVLQYLTTTQAGTPGFVLYPLHGLGLETQPMFAVDDSIKSYILFKSIGVCLTSQSNDFEAAFGQISSMASKLGVFGRVPRDTLRHFLDSRSMNWITRNPLLMVKIASHTGSYYENQFIYTLKIRLASSLAVMLHAVAMDRGMVVDKFRSSATTNNWETLDIRHYLVAETRQKRSLPLELRSVPMNLAAMELARLSDLTITLSSKTLYQSRFARTKRVLSAALKVVEAGHLTHVNAVSSDKIRRKVFSRIVTALHWYRQSFGSRVSDDEAVVALAIAFETLLTDHYSGGVRDRVGRRIAICLKGRQGVRRYVDSVTTVMEARGAIVNNGSTVKMTDRTSAQVAFAFCFEAIVDRLPSLGNRLDQPIGELLGDE